MNWNKYFALFFFSILFFAGCEKDKETSYSPLPPPVAKPKVTDYFPLTIGSYWVYEWHEIDTNGTDKMIHIDSTIVTNDTTINQKKYAVKKNFIIENNLQQTSIGFYRDSADYIVDNYGKIWFSNTNFTDTLQVDSMYDNLITIYYKMSHKDSLISISLGNYLCYDFEEIWKIKDPHCNQNKSEHHFYTKGIGQIKDVHFFMSDCNSPRYEHRLIRYKINKEK